MEDVKLIWRHGLSVLALLTSGAWSFFTVEGCPIHHIMFNKIPGLYPLNAHITSPPNHDHQKCLQTFPSVWGIKQPPTENHHFKDMLWRLHSPLLFTSNSQKLGIWSYWVAREPRRNISNYMSWCPGETSGILWLKGGVKWILGDN